MSENPRPKVYVSARIAVAEEVQFGGYAPCIRHRVPEYPGIQYEVDVEFFRKYKDPFDLTYWEAMVLAGQGYPVRREDWYNTQPSIVYYQGSLYLCCPPSLIRVKGACYAQIQNYINLDDMEADDWYLVTADMNYAEYTVFGEIKEAEVPNEIDLDIAEEIHIDSFPEAD